MSISFKAFEVLTHQSVSWSIQLLKNALLHDIWIRFENFKSFKSQIMLGTNLRCLDNLNSIWGFDTSNSLQTTSKVDSLAEGIPRLFVKRLSWKYNIFSHTCGCSRPVGGSWYFRFRFRFSTVFSFQWCNQLFGFKFEFVIVLVVFQLRSYMRAKLLGWQSSAWVLEMIKSV